MRVRDAVQRYRITTLSFFKADGFVCPLLAWEIITAKWSMNPLRECEWPVILHARVPSYLVNIYQILQSFLDIINTKWMDEIEWHRGTSNEKKNEWLFSETGFVCYFNAVLNAYYISREERVPYISIIYIFTAINTELPVTIFGYRRYKMDETFEWCRKDYVWK